MPQIPADDLADIFNASEFAMDAATVGAATVYGLFENEYIDVLDVAGTVPAFACRSSDVTANSIARGTSITINSTAYTVRNLKPNGSGITVLLLSN